MDDCLLPMGDLGLSSNNMVQSVCVSTDTNVISLPSYILRLLISRTAGPPYLGCLQHKENNKSGPSCSKLTMSFVNVSLKL